MNFDRGLRHPIVVAVLFLALGGLAGADEVGLDELERLAAEEPKKALGLLESLDGAQLSVEQRVRKARLMCEAYQDLGNAAKSLEATDQLGDLQMPASEAAAIQLCRAKARQRLGQVREAAEALVRARQAAVRTKDLEMTVQVMLQQGDLLMLQGQHDQAFAVLLEAYELAGSSAQPRTKHDVLNSLATVYYNTGRLDLAEKYYRELVEIAEAGDDMAVLAISLFNLGHAYASQQKFGEADAVFARSLQISREIDDQLGAAFTLKAWAESAQAQQELAVARDRLLEALAIFERAGELQQLASTRRHLGDVARAWGRPEEAIDHYIKAVPILERHNFQAALVRAYRGLAEAYGDKGDHARAYVIHQAYALLLKEHLEQQSRETTQRLQTQFETHRLAAENEKLELENARQKQRLEYDRQRLLALVTVVVLALAVIVLILILWRRGRQHARKMEQLATRDELTKIANRRAILEAGDAEWLRAMRTARPFCCLLLDIDHFKSINDTFGHSVGDEVLKQVAAQIKTTLRKTDAVGRFGGEEFLVVAAESGLAQAAALADRIRLSVGSGAYDAMPDRQVTVSIGVAQFDPELSLQQVIEQADQALYRAKEQGRNRVLTSEGGDR